jgi:hypothetical protein
MSETGLQINKKCTDGNQCPDASDPFLTKQQFEQIKLTNDSPISYEKEN